jgi:hypothetical protein
MAKKTEVGEVEPILKPSAKKAAAKKSTAKSAKSSNGNAQKAKQEKDERTQAAEKKKLQKQINTRVEKLKTAADKAGVKEKDVAAQYAPREVDGKPITKFKDFTEEESTAALAGLKELAKQKAKDATALAKRELNDEEKVTLKEMETQVRANIRNFQTAVFEIGSALTIISEQKLYRSTHDSFALYVEERFELGTSQAYDVMKAATLFRRLVGDQAHVDVKTLPSLRAALGISQRVDRLLLDSGYKGKPEEKAVVTQLSRNIYNLAVQTAPVDRSGKPILSPAHLDSVTNVLNDIAVAGAVELDGKQIPLNVAQAAIGEQIAEQSAERRKRLNQYLAQRVTAEAEAIRQGAIDRIASGAGTEGKLDSKSGELVLPEGVTPRLTMSCSAHGRGSADDVDYDHITLSCGCRFRSTTEGFEFAEFKPKAAKAETTAA